MFGVRALPRMTEDHVRIPRNMLSQNITRLQGSLHGIKFVDGLLLKRFDDGFNA
jgi:hypothetical protein